MNDLSNAWKLDIAAAGSRISDKSLSPVALTEMMLDRIGKINSKLLSYVTVLKNDALKSAVNAEKEIAGGKYRGPLHGIPIAIKDIYDTKGVRTTACGANARPISSKLCASSTNRSERPRWPSRTTETITPSR